MNGYLASPGEPVVIVGPAVEPITAFEAKAQCRIDVSDYSQDELLNIYIAAARDYIEWRAGMAIHEQTLEIALDYWLYCNYQGSIVLPRATPLIAVDSVKYVDSDGLETTWAANQYVVDTKARPGSIAPAYGVTFPSFIPQSTSAVRIRYRAGIATASPITEAGSDVKYPMLLLVAGMYENRESEVVPDRPGVGFIAGQYAVEAFIDRLQSRAGSYAF